MDSLKAKMIKPSIYIGISQVKTSNWRLSLNLV
jgi:hypothetical protein